MATLAQALAWSKRGFRIFPIMPNEKTPAIAAFQHAATTDDAVISAWWTDPVTHSERNYNIGVLTNDMIVMDVDTKFGRDGLSSYEMLGGHWDTLVVQTPSGGMHAYFKGPDRKQGVDILPGLDVRSHNGYVLAPGSYVDDGKVRGEYMVAVDHPLADVPPTILSVLEAPGQRRERDEELTIDSPTAINQAVYYLTTNAPPAVEGQGGDNQTYQIAAKLVRDYALSNETAFRLMLDHWNARCSPPWDAGELWKKVDNADQYATGQTGQALAEVMFQGAQIPEPTYGVHVDALYFGNAGDVATVPPRPWLMEGLFMLDAVSALGGGGGAGKSLLGLILCAHAVTGRPFGRHKFQKVGRAVYFDAEDDRDEQTRRLLAICTVYQLDYKEVKSRLMLISSDDFPILLATSERNQPVSNEPHIARLISILSQDDVHFAVLDPLIEMHACDENNPVHMKFVMSIFRRIARETHTSVCITHHTTKTGSNNDRAGNVEILRGSSAIPNACRVVLTLVSPNDKERLALGISEREQHDFVRLDDGKQNLSKRGSVGTWLKWESVKLHSGDLVGVLRSTEMAEKMSQQSQSIILILKQAFEEHSATEFSMTQACDVLSQYDMLYTKMSRTDLARRIQQALSTPVHIENSRMYVERVLQGKKPILRIIYA